MPRQATATEPAHSTKQRLLEAGLAMLLEHGYHDLGIQALLAGRSFSDARVRARALLAEVGLDHRETHKPRQLSGGEQQRVAVARALMNEPLVLLADEPSGNLDASTSLKLHELLFGLREKRQLSLIVVTHNGDLAARADRILVLEQGRLQPTARV
jgi:lipoprotein-releasing system ATP-binding protein